jgi:hypothetical protein
MHARVTPHNNLTKNGYKLNSNANENEKKKTNLVVVVVVEQSG